MDHQVDSLEGLFSKLHPCFPTETRICIVGAGPSGISAAYALCKLGYSNVTVIEKQPFVSGMCESIDIEGRIYDLGGQVLAANSAPTIFQLAKEVDAEPEEMDTHKFALITSSSTREYNDLKVVQDYVSMIPVTLKLQDEAKVSGREGVHGVSNIAADLTPSFLKDNGLQSILKSVAYGYAACGYGFVQDMPYAYVHEFTRTSIAGKIRRFKGGYMSFWQKLTQSLPIDLLCNTEVMSIKRSSSVVTVDVKDEYGTFQEMEFDIEGRIYGLGGQVLAANSAPTIFQLAKENDAEPCVLFTWTNIYIHTSGACRAMHSNSASKKIREMILRRK